MLEQIREDDVLWLRLHRPQVAHALDAALHVALVQALADAARRDDVGAVVLGASGERVFCAGADLKEFADLPAATAAAKRRELLLGSLDALLAMPKPVVACVQARAIGAGAMLALAADEIVMAEGAHLAFPEISFGMPSPMGAVMLAARSGRRWVQRAVQAGEPLEAHEALAAGCADEVVRAPALQARAQARARRLAAIAGPAHAVNKLWINQGLREALHRAAAAATAAARS